MFVYVVPNTEVLRGNPEAPALIHSSCSLAKNVKNGFTLLCIYTYFISNSTKSKPPNFNGLDFSEMDSDLD